MLNMASPRSHIPELEIGEEWALTHTPVNDEDSKRFGTKLIPLHLCPRIHCLMLADDDETTAEYKHDGSALVWHPHNLTSSPDRNQPTAGPDPNSLV